jgi:hypothetical protein
MEDLRWRNHGRDRGRCHLKIGVENGKLKGAVALNYDWAYIGRDMEENGHG